MPRFYSFFISYLFYPENFSRILFGTLSIIQKI